MLRRHKPKLVRIQHETLDAIAIEGVWVGMVRGHYHLRAAKTRVEGGQGQFLTSGEVLVPAQKVAFLEILAEHEG